MSDSFTPPPEGIVSNYPRKGYEGLSYRRPPGVYFDSIRTAEKMIRSHWLTYACCTSIVLAVVAPFYVSHYLTATFFQRNGFDRISGVLFDSFQVFLTTALNFCLVSVGVGHAQGDRPSLKDFFRPFKYLNVSAPTLAIAFLPKLLVIAVRHFPIHIGHSVLASSASIGLLLSIAIDALISYPLTISGMASIISSRPLMVTTAQIYTRLGPSILSLGILVYMAALFGVLGIVLCGVGLLITYPIFTNILALHYTYCFPEDQP